MVGLHDFRHQPMQYTWQKQTAIPSDSNVMPAIKIQFPWKKNAFTEIKI
jgi:hypothetical protein